MEDDQTIFINNVNFAQIVCLASYRETSTQAKDKRPIMSGYITTRILQARLAIRGENGL